ncbi:LytTR family DNA-binding domain-containing protein [Pseudahrensia aquimaris]|uniref:LytTR family DNA-binding domain-containing protein n=1 Tax=Pseudahrensia aquimaris TaxID=744461 RepID=A0ABW3FCM9_9HYPH
MWRLLTTNSVGHHVLMVSVLTLVFARLGPFGTYYLGPFQKLFYWGLALSLCGVIFRRMIGFAHNGTWLQEHHWAARILAGAALAAFPAGLVIAGLEVAFRDNQTPLADYPRFVFHTFIIGSVIGTLWFKVLLQPEPQTAEAFIDADANSLHASPPQNNPFLSRLPVNERDNLLSLSMQDHYVETYTTQGRHMLLMRFSQAMDELKGFAGIQIHRSHWVSLDAVIRLYRSKGRTFVLLKDDRSLPVSETFRKVAIETLGPEMKPPAKV